MTPLAQRTLALSLSAVTLALAISQQAYAQVAPAKSTKLESFVEPVRKRSVERNVKQAFAQGKSIDKSVEDPFLCTRIMARDLQHRYEYAKAAAPGEPVSLSMIFAADKLKEGRISLKVSHGNEVGLLEGIEHERTIIKSGEVYKSSWAFAPKSNGIHPVTIELATDNQSRRNTVSQTFYLITTDEGTRVTLTEPEREGATIIRRGSPKADMDLMSGDGFENDGAAGNEGRESQFRAATYTVSGTVRVDNGLGTTVPVPGVRIRLEQKNSSQSSTYYNIGETYTRSDGTYTLTFSDSNLRSMRLKAYPDGAYAYVVDEGGYYPTLTSASWTPTASNRAFNWNMAGENRKWFFVMSKLYQASQAARNSFGTADMPKIQCELEPGDPAHAGAGWIGLGRECWNNEDTIRHEYGHCHYAHIAGGFPPNAGGSHNFGQDGTAGMALSEGYATFFHCVAANRRSYDYSVPSDPHDIDLERGCFSWSEDVLFDGDRDEGSVAAVFVDIWDEAGEANDNLNVGARRVSDVIRGETPDNLSQFYAYWNRNLLSQLADFRVNLQGRGINYGWRQ